MTTGDKLDSVRGAQTRPPLTLMIYLRSSVSSYLTPSRPSKFPRNLSKPFILFHNGFRRNGEGIRGEIPLFAGIVGQPDGDLDR
jgi:hypothetical protein